MSPGTWVTVAEELGDRFRDMGEVTGERGEDSEDMVDAEGAQTVGGSDGRSGEGDERLRADGVGVGLGWAVG